MVFCIFYLFLYVFRNILNIISRNSKNNDMPHIARKKSISVFNLKQIYQFKARPM